MSDERTGDGYEPDVVLSIARGGMLVGAALAYALDIKNTWTVNVEFYIGVPRSTEPSVRTTPRVPALS